MRVLIAVYCDSERSGGSVRVAEVLAKSLQTRGAEVFVVVAYGMGGRLKKLLGEHCHLIEARGPKDLLCWWNYRKLLNALQPDVIHFVDSVGWMFLASLGAKARRIFHQHFRPDVGPNGGKDRFLRIRVTGALSDKVIAISHGAGRQLVSKCRVAARKVSVIHNAIDPSYLCDIDARGSSEKCILGMAIRLVKDKGVEDALRLLAMLPPKFELLIAGDGPDLKRIQGIAIDLGVSDRVNYLGSVADVRVFYAKIDFYLFMSWYEGFGLSVAEAMFCQKPIVGLLGDGEIAEAEYPLVTESNSLLVSRSSLDFAPEKSGKVFEILRDRVIALEDDKVRQIQLIEAAFKWVSERFSSEIFATKVIDAYRQTLGTHTSVGRP